MISAARREPVPAPPARREPAAAEWRELLEDAHHQLADRDREIDRLHCDVDRFRDEYARTRDELAALRRTRVWRVVAAYWRVRDRLRRR
jgi:hypothetical protein